MRFFIVIFMALLCTNSSSAQVDSVMQQLQSLPVKYIKTVEDKITVYQHRISSKTEKTLTKLARWEKKIQSALQKVNPEAAQRLFGEGKLTFTTALQKLKQGQQIAEGYKAKYDAYRDKLTTSLNYLQEQKDKIDNKLVKPLQQAKQKADALEEDISNRYSLGTGAKL